MKTFNNYFAIICMAATMLACSKESGPSNKNLLAGDPCEVQLIITSDPTTRGITDDFEPGTDHENKVSVLEFYVFDSDGNPDPEVGRVDENTQGNGYKKVTTTNNAKVHKITMAGGNDKKIVAVINMELGELATNTYDGLKAEMAKHVYTANSTDGFNARTEERTLGFEMSGEAVFSLEAGSINNSVTVNISRIASRINAPVFNTNGADFVNLDEEDLQEIWGEDYMTTLDGKTLSYREDGYVVINGRAKSDLLFIGNPEGKDRKTTIITTDGNDFIIPDWSDWNSNGKPCIASTFATDGTGLYESVYSGESASGDWFLNGLEANNEHRVYVYENKPEKITVDGTTGYNPKETYALIIKGTFVVGGDDANNKTRYWRIDLTRDDDYHIYRNAYYKITVNKISTPGYASPEEAEKSNPVIPGKDQTAADVKIVVSEWRLNTYETEM